MKNYRHWDVALIGVAELPSDIKESKTKVFLVGKNNSHSIDMWKIYLLKDPNTLSESEFLYWYIQAKNTKLLHSEHSNKWVKIEDWFYALYKQKEETPNWFKLVID